MQNKKRYGKHACQNTVAMEIPNCCQIIFLGKVAKFCGFCFNVKEVINAQSQCGHFLLPPPPRPNRVKVLTTDHVDESCDQLQFKLGYIRMVEIYINLVA